MSDGSRRTFCFALAFGVFALDRGSKWLVDKQLGA